MSANSYPISANIFRRAMEDDPRIICRASESLMLSKGVLIITLFQNSCHLQQLPQKNDASKRYNQVLERP